MRRIVIAGCGAAGMCAAVAAARCGACVTVIEKNNEAGKKLSMTGNGRCNLSNLIMNAACFETESDYCKDTAGYALDKSNMPQVSSGGRVGRWLSRFGSSDTITFFKSIGVLTINEDGYLYPRSGQAQTVTDALKAELSRIGVSIVYGLQVKSVSYDEKTGSHIVRTSDKGEYSCDAVIMATGGLSGPTSTMSTGDGYYIAERLGAQCTPKYPALVYLKTNTAAYDENTGVRAEAEVIFTFDCNREGKSEPGANESKAVLQEEFARESGEIQITRGAISGIPVLQAGARVAQRAGEKGPSGRNKVTAHVNFFPECDNEQYRALINDRMYMGEGRSIGEFLNGLCNSNINHMILKRMGILEKEMTSSLTDKDTSGKCKLDMIFEMYRDYSIEITGTGDFKSSQCTMGGVSLDFLTDELEIISSHGVYVAGELADINGRCGGYNLQWAWTSGAIAGCAAAGMPMA